MASYLKGIILLIALVVLVTFGIKNSQLVRLHYYFNIVSFEIPLYGIVYLSVIIGIIIGMIVGVLSRFTLRRKAKYLQRENSELKKKISEEEEQKEHPLASPAEKTEQEV